MSLLDDYKELDVDELEEETLKLKRELYHLHTQKQMEKKAEKPHRFRQLRRDIARIKTLVQQKRDES